ncbi:MAG TPA: TonB-dependent receptor [Flavobacteriales bacterium]|nr:TonB-dependent receptor [Flavobacteriales bacterium]HMR26002.1 TonB-dependent receptor [Flavobacteriales bacterium]
MRRTAFVMGGLLCCCGAQAQAVIRGVVAGPEGPVPFAAVRVGALGTAADAEGRFHVGPVPTGGAILRIEALGHHVLERVVQLPASDTLDLGTLRMDASATALDEVVVTGTLAPVSRDASPVPVEVITPALFRKNPGPSLLDAVGMVNGVRPQLNCSVCNTGDIHINGMEGPYTLVLIDGMPIVSGLSTVYGLSGIPTTLIERVEVVKGPGSTLYGSEAMGGIINVITKDPVLAPRLSVDLMSTSWQEHNADVGFALGQGRLRSLTGMNGFLYDAPRDDNGDGFTDMTLQKRVSVFEKLTLLRPAKRVASLAMRAVGEDRWGGEMDWKPAFAGGDSIYGETISTRRWELIGQYQLPLAEQVIMQVSANGHHQDSWYGTTPYDAVQRVLFAQLVWRHRFVHRHNMLAGLAYRSTFYDDNTPATSTGEAPGVVNNAERRPLPGIFLQDEWSMSDRSVLLVGYRLDHDRDHGLVQSPRLAWKYAPSGRFTLRASAGTGYRVVNLFTEDHAALTGARTVVIAEDLLPERSWNATLNAVRKWPGEKRFIGLDASLFVTRFSNRILPDYDTDPDLIVYRNLDGYGVAQGASLNMEARIGRGFRANAGATWMDVYIREGAVREDQFFAPEWQGTIALSQDLPHRFTVDLTGQWYGPMRLPVQPNDFRPAYSPWYALLNVQVRHRFNGRFEVYGGVKNLLNFVPADPLMRPFDPFDRTADDPVSNPNGYSFDTSYMYAPLQGVRGFLGVRMALE